MTTATPLPPITMPLPPGEKSPDKRFATAADWWATMAGVPMERIVFKVPPGTATPGHVILVAQGMNKICELVHGTLVEKAMGTRESQMGVIVASMLLVFVRAKRLGVVTGEAGGYRILPDQVRYPDVAFVSNDRLTDGKLPNEAIATVVPDLAVEILSESNTRREMENKLRDYFTAGVRLVWYIDPLTRTVDVFTSPLDIQRLGEAGTLTGGNVLPGFEAKVADFYMPL